MSEQPLALIVSPFPGTRGGGVERFCALVGESLAADGWRTEEVGPGREPTRWVRRFGGASLSKSRSAGRELAGRGADLIVSNGELGAFSPAGAPRIHVFHGTMAANSLHGDVDLPLRERIRRGVGDGLAEALAGRCEATVAVSRPTAGEVARYYRLAVDTVIYPGVDTEAFRPRDRVEARRRFGLPDDGRLALFVGRLEGRKGSDLLEPACARAGYDLVVAGRSAPARGHHLGLLSHGELPWAYAAADVVVFPTRYEGYGFVTVEGLACGVPVITTETGWAPALVEAVPGYRPLIVRPEVDSVAAALAGLVENGREEAVADAAALVREHNSLAAFRKQWSELVAGVVPDAAHRARAAAG